MNHVVDVYQDLLEWVECKKIYLNPAQMSALLISVGATVAFNFAPNEEDAREVIEEAIRLSLDDYREKSS